MFPRPFNPYSIEKYKEEMAEFKARREEEMAKAKLPPGTKLMPEEERVATLDELVRQKKEIQETIEKMPLSMRSDALKAKKREMEEKMNEIERAITTFSRKFVYVADKQ